jgi:hypothetical protein
VSGVQDLINRVNAFQNSGTLTASQASALLKPLNSALSSLNNGKVPPAIDYLQTFLDHVRNDVKMGILSSAQATPLLNEGCDLVRSLGGVC